MQSYNVMYPETVLLTLIFKEKIKGLYTRCSILTV